MSTPTAIFTALPSGQVVGMKAIKHQPELMEIVESKKIGEAVANIASNRNAWFFSWVDLENGTSIATEDLNHIVLDSEASIQDWLNSEEAEDVFYGAIYIAPIPAETKASILESVVGIQEDPYQFEDTEYSDLLEECVTTWFGSVAYNDDLTWMAKIIFKD